MDVGMYREDYNKFMEQAPALLPEGIFLQNYKSDPMFPHVYAKLRNSNTTAIERAFQDINMNHGIYIDIFSLDGYPADKFEQKKLEVLKRHYRALSLCGVRFADKMPLKSRVATKLRKMLGFHKRTAKTLKKYEAFIEKYPVNGSEFICNHGTPYGRRDYISAEYYGKGAITLFEGIEVRVPEKSDEYLTALYGDWRTPPPIDKRNGGHLIEICDVKKPYTEYLKFNNQD